MAARAPVGGRPGARFAQFKLVLLGELLRDNDSLSTVWLATNWGFV